MQLFDTQPARKSTVDVVIDSIKESLIQKRLKPGDLLPCENELCEQLKVSRSPVREAMKILSAYGIVEIKRGEGTYVAKGANSNMFMPLLFRILVQDHDMNALIEVRQMLEESIVRLVIAHAQDNEIAALENIAAEFASALRIPDADGAERARTLDLHFHRTMAAYTHNAIVEGIYGFVMELFEPSIDPRAEGVVEAHATILQGLTQRDVDVAMRGMKDHLHCWTAAHRY